MLQQAVVSAFDDRQAEIARMAKRIKPRTLLHLDRFQLQKSFMRPARAQQCEIVNDVHAENRRRGHLPRVSVTSIL